MRAHNAIHHFLEESTRLHANKVALIHEETRATYAEINEKANALARWLMAQGVASGDRVVLLFENSLEYVVGYYATLKSGAAVVSLAPSLKPDGLAPLLAEIEPKVLIASPKCERMLHAMDLAASGLQTLLLKSPTLPWSNARFAIESWDDAVQSGSVGNLDLEVSASALASIIYTSGSTGKPKGVMLSHRNILANTQSIVQYLNLNENEVQLVVLPFFYVMGKSLLNTHFAVGSTVVLNNKFAFPATVVNQMVDERVTGFSGVPSTYAYLLHRSPLAQVRDRLESLRYCSQAGGHMSDATKRELRQTLPEHTKIVVMYGATEASARLTYLDPDRFEDKMGSIGKPIPGTALHVLRPDGTDCSVGEVGEFVGQGDNIMMGYWKDPEGTSRVLDDRGYHTGDLGTRDEEGFFFVTGRRDGLLKVGGHRINTQEIEDMLMDTQLVVEAVVLGQPDSLLGNKLVVLACPRNGNCTDRLILEACSKTLPQYKVPSTVKLVRALPKNANGKIDRGRCLDLCASCDCKR